MNLARGEGAGSGAESGGLIFHEDLARAGETAVGDAICSSVLYELVVGAGFQDAFDRATVVMQVAGKGGQVEPPFGPVVARGSR